MNKIYKVIWSKVKHQYVVVSELAHRDGKRSSIAGKSVKTMLAVCALCSAVMFGGYGMPNVYAAGADTLPGQYIAIGGATTAESTANDGHWEGRWPNREWVVDTYYRDLEDASGTTHRYVYTQGNDGNYYWVREGYSIEIVENKRYPTADKNTVINTYKGANADSDGLVQSYQNVQENMNIGTLNGDTLFTTNTDMYGGAVNTSTTAITTGQNYRIEQNGRYIEAGLNNLGSYFNTEDVVYHENTGLYTFHGQVVGTENLYVIGGNVGVFTTTANGDTLYTGDVYGRNNEILMTAVDENGNLVSYWGAEIVDPNATIGSMTISTLEGKFDEVNKNIEKIHKDDIKEIQVAPTGTSTDGQGGTIGLQTNGAFDADGNPTGGKVIPGGITVTSIGGTNGKDVQVQFSNTDPDTKQTNSFTVNAGSKVVGKVGEVTATEGQTLDGISINGVDYKLGGGQNYTAGNNVHINGNVISADGTKVSADEGNFTVTPTTNEETNVTDYNIKLNNVVTVGSGENTKPVQIDGVNGQVTGLTNKTLDVEGFATSSRAATEEQLKLVQDGAANINLTNITEGGKTVIKGLEQHITPGEYKVQADGTVTMNYVDGNGQTITGQTAKITGIASESAVKAAKSEVAAGTNVDVTTSTGTDGQTVYTVNADGTTVSADEGNFTVTPTTNEETNVTDYNIKLNNVVTVGSGENTKPVQIDGVNGQVTGLTNKTLDVEGFATSSRAATEEQLKLVQDGAANINLTNITEGGKTVIKGLEQHITPGEYKVQADGTVTMNYVDGNGQTVTGQTAKITGIASESAVAAAKTTVSSSNNISAVGTQQADGHMDYNVKLNDNVYLGGDQTADNSNIALEGSTGSIHAATTKGNHTFDFDSNGGKFETTTVDDSLLVDMPIIGKNGVVTTTTNTSEFNQSGATFTKTGKVETYLGDQVITTTLIPKTFTNIDGSKITSDAGVLGGQTVVDGGSVTVQGAGSVLGTHTTTVEGSKITSVGTWGSLLGDTTEIDGAYINAGGIEVNGEPLRDTITGLSNTEWKNDEAWQKTHIRDDRAATEGQLQDVADSLSGDVSKLDDFAVKYDEVNGKPDYDKVTLEGKDGTKITNLAKGKVTATSTDAVNGSQLFEVQELAGKHTTMTVNNGMAAPENGSYTTDGNLQLKQKVGDKGQIEYDVKLNDNLVLGNGDSQITLNGAPTDENAPAISVGEVFTVGQDGSVHAAVAGDSTSDSMSFTNGGLTISNMSGDVSSATVIKGADIQAGGIHLDGTDKIIAGLSNTKWTGMTTTPDKAATEGQLQTVSDTVASGWTATDDKGYKINVNPNTHPTLNFASGKNVTVNAENDEINVALNDDIVLGGSGELAEEQDNRVTLSGTNGTIMATTNFNDMSATTTINGGNVYVGSSVSVGDTVVITDKDITGLSNTTWNGQTDDVSRAATEGQLKVVSDNVNAGWIATDNNGNEITVNPKDNTLNFSGDRNVTVEANKEDGSIDVSLNDDIVLGGKDGSTSRVQIGGTDGVITVTKDANDMGATTTIAGGDIYAGSSVTVGDTVKLTTEDITGLSNTTWDGTTDDVSRAATEGQLQTVADTVNAGWTATDDAGNKINVNPKDHPTLNFASGKNVTVSAADGEISVSLNDEVKLGDYDNGTGIYLSGASGTISATNSISVGEDLVIDGNKKTVNGLSNKTWSKDSFVSGQAATEDQLDAMADWTETQVNNSGWTASTNGGKKTEAITNGETVDFSNTDGNIKVSQDVTANGTSIKFNLNDDLLLGANADEGAGINLSGTAGEIAIKSANGSTINIGNGVITGLTNTVSNENWETFMNGDLGKNGRAVTEDDLQLVAQHSVQYKTNDDGTIDYNNIFLNGTSYSSDGHIGGTMITNVAYASDSDGSAAVNVDKLHDAISDAKTEVTNADKHLNYDKTYSVDRETNKVNLEVVDNQGNVVGNTTIEDVASATDVGNIGDLNSDIAHDSTGDGNVSIVDAVNNVDNKVGDLNYKHDDGSDLNYVTAGDSVTGAIGDLDAAIKDAATEAGQHSSVSGSDNITVAENGTNGNGGTDYKVSLNDDLTLGGKEGQSGSIAITGSEGTITASGNVSAGSFTTGSIAINKENSGTITGLSNTTWNKEVADAIAANANGEAGTAATQGQLQQAMNGAVQYDTNKDGSVNKDSITLGGSTYNEETHEGGTTITNVADGKNASDAVNMSQLWQTNQAVINNSNNIQSLSNQVGKLDNRIDEVGAGAAALAALHPLDFDPDDKWDFSAGYGNYRGESAVAVGAFYRPNEDTMFSVGGTVGNGDNMVNAGVSFKIGQGNSVSTSRVAMAKEIKSMRDIVAKQDAQIQKLTAMVNALVGIQAEPDTTTMFPDVPENHWAYEAVAAMAKGGLVKGYPDGEFKGDRTMTRYEFAQIVYNAIQAGAEVDARLVQEFQPELQYFRVDTVAQDKNGNPTIQRVRVNDIPVQQ